MKRYSERSWGGSRIANALLPPRLCCLLPKKLFRRAFRASYIRNDSATDDEGRRRPLTSLSQRTTNATAEDLRAAANAANVPVFLQLLKAASNTTSGTESGTSAALRGLSSDLLVAFAAARHLEEPGLAGILAALQPDAGRFVHRVDDLGRSPLHVAMFWQRAEQTQALLAVGASTDLRDQYGRTPLEMPQQISMSPQLEMSRCRVADPTGL